MCSSCSNKNKITSPLLQSATNRIMSLSNSDFIDKIYIGDTKPYRGLSTGINYGIKSNNTKFMIHIKDFEADSSNFTDIVIASDTVNVSNTSSNNIVGVKRNVRKSKRTNID